MQTVITYYKNLIRWDVKYFFNTIQAKNGWEILKLSDFLRLYKKKIEIDENTEYKQITIKINHKGVIERGIQKGKDIKTRPQFEVKRGQFIISKIDAKDGAFGIIPNNLDKAIITGSFVAFNFDKNKINQEFFDLYISQDWFLNILRSISVGTTGRKPIMVDDFLNLEIQIPPLKIQEKIVSDWRKAQKEAQELNKIADEKEKAIDDYILRELGIEKKEYEKKKGVFVAWFKDLERWGINFNSYDWNLDNLFESEKYKTEHLNRVAIINKTYQFTKEDLQKEVLFVPMESVSDIEGEIKTPENKKLDEIKKGFTRFAEGDIIFAKITPCMENGKCAIANNLTNGIGIGSTEFHVLTPNKSLIDTKYLWTFLRLRTFRKSAERFFIGSAGQQRVPVNFLEEIKIPLPPLPKQKGIAKKVEAIRAEIAEIKGKANNILETTQKEIGEMLKV